MRTGEDSRELGLYATACCLQEMIFDAKDTFRRCPKCERLCKWELVEPVVAWTELEGAERAA
jgi:hypothetical protein